MARVFFNSHLKTGQIYRLSDEAARHVQVLRMQPGMRLDLFNGLGGYFGAMIDVMDKQGVSVQVMSFHPADHTVHCHTHLVIGMPANERMDWLVEKATELGVSQITPVMTQRTVLKLQGERAAKRQVHWMGIAQSACAQSGRNRVPLIDAPLTWSEWLGRQQADSNLRVLLSLAHDIPGWRELWLAPPSHLTLLSGPEGGLTPKEEAQAVAIGFKAASLGSMTLRAETAAIAVLAQLL